MQNIKLVIFDMDGTILDTETISLRGIVHVGKTLGVEIAIEIAESLMGKTEALRTKILRENYNNLDIKKAFELHLKYVDNYFEEHGVPVKAGVFELLDFLDEKGIKKCVATSTAKARAVHKLTEANLAHRFETITGGDEVKNGKPAPDVFLKAAERCGISAQDSIVIEDTEAGITGAVAANIPVIAVPDIAPLTEEMCAKAFRVCKNLTEVKELLARSN